MYLYVCPLSHLEGAVKEHDAGHVLTLINLQTPVPTPPGIAPEDHLFLGMNDIAAPREGFVPPSSEQVQHLIDFASGWDRRKPVIVHCWAGVSRSTAAAFTVACALQPDRAEQEIAKEIRFLSPTASPNPMIVGYADGLLNRSGRMVDAVRSIGRGQATMEGVPFRLDV